MADTEMIVEPPLWDAARQVVIYLFNCGGGEAS